MYTGSQLVPNPLIHSVLIFQYNVYEPGCVELIVRLREAVAVLLVAMVTPTLGQGLKQMSNLVFE